MEVDVADGEAVVTSPLAPDLGRGTRVGASSGLSGWTTRQIGLLDSTQVCTEDLDGFKLLHAFAGFEIPSQSSKLERWI